MSPEFQFDEQIDQGERKRSILTLIAYASILPLALGCIYLGYLASTP